jgi:hypothetical protein
MFGSRRMMRRAARGAVRGAILAGRGAGREQVREAQRLMANGQFVEAASLFVQLSNEALERGFIKPAGFLAVQAARAYAQAKQGEAALTQARHALDILLHAGNPQQAARLMPHAIAFLRAQGFSSQAAALEKEATQRLAELGLSLQSDGVAMNRSLPATCPQCAGPLRADDAEWIDANSVECPWCGSTVKAQ